MDEYTRLKGVYRDVELYRDSKGKLLRAKWGEIEFISLDVVNKKQEDLHKQLTLVSKSIEGARSQQILAILTDEAKMLRDQLSDIRQIKHVFSKV